MNKLNSFKDSFLEKNDRNEDNYKIDDTKIKPEKVLCNHCGRTANNDIRCLGICVADNEY